MTNKHTQVYSCDLTQGPRPYACQSSHWPARATVSSVNGILGSMSDTFNAGRQDASWALLCWVCNSKPGEKRGGVNIRMIITGRCYIIHLLCHSVAPSAGAVSTPIPGKQTQEQEHTAQQVALPYSSLSAVRAGAGLCSGGFQPPRFYTRQTDKTQF